MRVLVLVFVLAGCASGYKPAMSVKPAGSAAEVEPVPTQSLLDRYKQDLQVAAEMADRATDPMAPVRAKCYRALSDHLLSAPQLPIGQSVGVVSAFEVAAESAEVVKAEGDEGVPLEVRVACSPVVTRANAILLQFNLRLLGAAALVPK